MTFKTADLCDEFKEKLAICKQPFQSYGKRKVFSGTLSTVKVFEDNVLVKQALEMIPKGNVLVVDAGGSMDCALVGDNLAAIAINRGLSGIIMYGCVRDTAVLAQMDVGILALGSNPLRSKKDGGGELDVTVTFGKVDFKPGNYVYVDEDGVITSEKKLV